MSKIKLENEIVEYKIIKSNRKTAAIQIDKQGDIAVKVPVYFNEKYIEIFLRQNEEWLIEKLRRVEELKLKYQKRKYLEGEKFLYLGEELPLEIEKAEGNGIALALKESCFYAKINVAFYQEDRAKYLRQAFVVLYKKIARRVLVQKTEYFSGIIGVKFNKIFIKEQKTCWGSCSGINNINYNWKIIMAPEKIVDYLVVHELCHIKFRNHSKEYWNEVSKYVSDYKARRDWLKENGSMLDVDKKIRK